MTDFWLHSIRQQVQSWFTKAQVITDGMAELSELPPPLLSQIEQRLHGLPCPKPYQEHVRETLLSNLQTWQQNSDAPNSLVMLGSPVESLATILQTSLQNWDEISHFQILEPLNSQRPDDPLTIDAKIQQLLESYSSIQTEVERSLVTAETALDKRRIIVLVPSLEQCFLRCIGGWDGIETLRALITQNRQCFWVVGCNRWAWDFLDFVCQISADFSEVQTLARLDGKMLQDWFNPLVRVLIAEENQGEPLSQKPGDRVQIGDHYGEVVGYGLRAIQLQTPDDNTVTIPHNTAWTDAISNANSGKLEAQVATDFYLDQRVDSERVIKILYQAAYSSKYTQLKLPIVVVMAEHFWCTQFKLRAYPIDARDEFIYKTDLIRRTKKAFAHWHIAYPRGMGRMDSGADVSGSEEPMDRA